jgi:TRAP-type C4-dicarboxylate transport system permease small subunit
MKRTFDLLCGLACSTALFAIMLLTFVDVSSRKALGRSVTGSLELTEMLMVVVIFASLPLVSRAGEHVSFDSLDRLLPAPVRRVQRAVIDVVCGAALIGLGWLLWQAGADLAQAGEVSSQLGIPKSPFVRGMGLFSALTGLVHLVLALRGPAAADGDAGAL